MQNRIWGDDMIKISYNGIVEQISLDGLDETKTNYIRAIFRELMHRRNISLRELIDEYNKIFPEHTTTSQNISNKLTRDAMKFRDVVELAEAMGYDIAFVEKDGLTRVNPADSTETDDDPPRITPKVDSMQIEMMPRLDYHDDSLNSAVAQGFEMVEGFNFKKILVAGERALEASFWIKEYIEDGMTELEEMTVLMTASQLFDIVAKPVRPFKRR